MLDRNTAKCLHNIKGLHTATSLNQQHVSCSKSCDANRKLGLSDCQSSVCCGCCAPHGENSCTGFHRNTATDEAVSPVKVQELHKHCARFMVFQFSTGQESLDKCYKYSRVHAKFKSMYDKT